MDVPDQGSNPDEVRCDPDNSFSIDSFYDGTLGELSMDDPQGDTICPRRDIDYWRFNMPTDSLARVDLQYNKLSNIQLGVQWWRLTGKCTSPSPASCTNTPDCMDDTLICDDLRGCIAGNAPDCYASGTDECPETCFLSPEPLPREVVLENQLAANPSEHRVVAYFPAFNGGEHFVVLKDQQEVEEDDEVQYTLEVTQITDPDPNEPNNNPTDATPLGNSATVEGYLSYQLDTDWYEITPGFASPAVIDIELRSDASNVSDPTWIIYQGDFRLDSVNPEIEGTGTDQQRVRANTLVVPGSGPIIIEVRNQNTSTNTPTVPAFNPDESYTLTVSVFEDTDEGLNRDDNPTDANVVALGATPGAGGVQSFTGTIIARNDSDWYRLDAGDFPTPSGGNNSLLFSDLSADDPATAGFQLLAQFFKPNGTGCSPSLQCPGGLACAEDIGECLDLWVQRPNPSGPGNPELGGLSPNLLRAMLPLHRSNLGDDPRVYLRISHDQSTRLDIPGFDQTAQYSIDLEHLAEPDDGDRAGRDNDFLPQPLVLDGRLRPSDYNAVYRTVNTATVTPVSGGQEFAQLVPGTVVTPGMCQAVPLEAWTAEGGLSSSTFTVTTAAPALVADCADTTMPAATIDVTFASGVGSVNVIVPPMGMGPQVITIGGRDYTLGEDAARAMTVENEAGAAYARAFPVGSAMSFSGSETLRVRFPAILQANEEIVATPTGGIIACASNFNGTCEGSSFTPAGPALCGRDLDTPPGSDSACTLVATPGNDFYAFQLISDGTSPLITVEFTSASGAFDPVRVSFSAFEPSSASLGSGEIVGFISYDGDQDFYRVDVSGVLNAGLTGYLDFPASEVDIRVSLERGGSTVPVGFQREEDDLVTCSGGATPTQYNTCSQPALNNIGRGPLETGDCVYAVDGDTVDVWVNEIYSNDFDLNNSYTVYFELVAGCPTPQCNAFVCSQ